MRRLFNISVMFVLLLGFIPQSTAIAEVLPLWEQLPDGEVSVYSDQNSERICPISVVVGNTNDSGAGSLRQAIADACADGTITFDASLTGTTITLASQLTLETNVTIDGSDLASMVIVSGDSVTRVMKVNEGVTATLKSFRISHGNFGGNGIGIYNSGTLTLDTMTLFDNLSTDLFGFGGGVFNNGTLTVNNSSFSSNSAYNGGAIYSEGTLSIVDTNLYENSAAYGGVIYNASQVDPLDITNSSLTGNRAIESGGAIYNTYGATATLTGCSISANTASDGGGISINSGASVTVSDSTVSGNTASTYGGGISISAGGSATVSGSTFLNNSGGTLGGGGIQNFGTITVVNSTFTGNVTSESVEGSAINNGYGGVLTLYHSTLSGNTGWVTLENGNNARMSLANTIIANTNSGWDCSIYSGILTESVNNWVEDGASGGETCGAIFFGDPQLGSLADNGGPTQTMALLETSGAIEAADDTICAGELVGGVDQRGEGRPYGSHCDIGAYEWGAEITGSLSISKVFDPLTSGFTGTFNIFYDCGGEYWAYRSLSAGGSVTVEDIPIGSHCTISETNLPTPPIGWSFGTPTISPTESVTIGETLSEVSVTNTISRDLGELRISKVFNPLTSGFSGTFAINYDCDDGTSHDGTVHLAAGGSQTITGIPTGTQCTITEPSLPTAPEGWLFLPASYSPIGATVTVSEKSPAYAAVIVTNNIQRKLGALRISKIFDPLTSGFTGTFAIAYDCDDGTAHDGTVHLAAGGSQTITGIPTGTQCTVTEPGLPTAPSGWAFGTPTFSPEDGNVVIGEVIAVVIITNTIEQPIFRIFLPLIIKSNAGR